MMCCRALIADISLAGGGVLQVPYSHVPNSIPNDQVGEWAMQGLDPGRATGAQYVSDQHPDEYPAVMSYQTAKGTKKVLLIGEFDFELAIYKMEQNFGFDHPYEITKVSDLPSGTKLPPCSACDTPGDWDNYYEGGA